MAKKLKATKSYSGPLELSVIVPIYKEGEEFKVFLKELVEQLDEIGRNYEVIVLDSPTAGNSINAVKDFIKSESRENIYVAQIKWTPPTVTDKSNKYMVGYHMAKGKYIIQMDGDGQDVPAEIPKFIEKLEEGFDMVTGYKQKRKDGELYMLTSKIANTLNRVLSGTTVHDMNCGFKGFPAHIAKSLVLRSGYFRFLPAIFAIKKYSVTEVPVKHRERAYGSGKFNFVSRLQGGVFDLLSVVIVTRMGETPIYFYGWLTVIFTLLAISTWFMTGLWWLLFGWMFMMISGIALANTLLIFAMISALMGINVMYQRVKTPVEISQLPLHEVYPARD